MNKFTVSICLAIVTAASATIGLAKEEMTEMAMPSPAQAPQKGVHAQGTIMNMNKSTGEVRIKHAPIPALRWPAMTMAFKVQDAMLLNQVKVGDQVHFTLVPSGQEYMISSFK